MAHATHCSRLWMASRELPDRRVLIGPGAGLSLRYSSGAVEGHNNKIKMLKRQMFGRANFDLLRKRVLLTASGRS